MNYIVETKHLKKYYQMGDTTVKALDGIDFCVKDQEFIAIIGKSGSGKSTLLHMLGGLDTPTDGRKVDTEYVNGILKLLRISEKKDMLPGTLSGGQQQRVAIARALATKPAIILADEPTGNLDSATSHEVLGLLKMVAKQFCQTIILITHDRDIAQLADRIVHIEDGKIVSDTKEGM